MSNCTCSRGGNAQFCECRVEIENLTLSQLDQALRTGGYLDNALLTHEFKGYTVSGKARYAITYGDDTGEGHGIVFVENVPGVGFVADF